MSLNKNTVPHVLYNIPNPDDPEHGPSELYMIQGTVLDKATDPVKRWVVREEHGYWDEQRKEYFNRAPTFLPNDPQLCLSLEEVYEEIKKQVMVRVRSGFRYQMEFNPFGPLLFRKFEVQADGSRREYT